MRYRGTLGWLIGLTVMLGATGVAQAATVTTNADSGTGSLRAAINAAASGETIDFAPALQGQTITLSSALVINQSVTIAGPGAALVTISGNNTSRVFDVEASGTVNVTISGLTITKGTFSGTGDGGGGGVFVANFGTTLTLTDDLITDNHVTQNTSSSSGVGGGGAVFVNGGPLAVNGSTITNNSFTITGVGSGDSGGGGLYDNGGDVTVASSDVSHNTVTQSNSFGDCGGGGVYSDGGTLDISASTVRDNSVQITSSSGGDDGGGGVFDNGEGVSIQQTAVDGNSFTLTSATGGDYGGGGVYENGGPVTVVFSTVDGNSMTVGSDTGGDNGGGGVHSEGGDISVGFSSISDNTANITDSGGDDGGGAVIDEGGDSVYLDSTLSGNSVTVSGGGTGNGGGAIFVFGASLINNVTIAGNDTNMPGGAIFSDAAVQFRNTIVAGNTATPAGNCAGGGFTSGGFNLESADTCGFNATGDLVNTDPRLGPLQNNGGPFATRTQALLAGSPAIDAGSCTTVLGSPETIDQRGVARPQPAGGKCDIGAFELAASAPPPPPPAAKPAAVPGRPAATRSTTASFSGSVNPEGQATTVFFEYGLDARDRPPGGPGGVVYDQSTAPQSLPADSTTHTVTASVSGLVPNAHYHVRLVATNATGTTFGADQTFVTPADPPPPAPVLAKSVNAKPVGGKVFLLVGGKLVRLTENDQLRAGTVVDTRHGSLQLTTATSKKRKRQTGTFSGAIFKITQVRSGLTTLSLVNNALHGAPSFASCKSRGAHAAKVSKKTLQLLHSSGKGKFRTKGRYAAATVRGTKWTIADRCDGTLTHDLTDSVVVNDFVRHKTIVLHAGQSYLAKATVPKKKKKP